MGDKTGISWTDATANVVVGCSRISEGCQNCYAERLAATRLAHTKRYKGLAVMRESGEPQWSGEVRLVPEAIEQVLRWRNPRKVFLTAMGDPFHDALNDDEIAVLFGVMAASRQHTFQVLTKRPERMRRWFESYDADRIGDVAVDWLHEHTSAETGCGSAFDPDDWPLKNVWLGVSVENQATANERIPRLLATPASVRFLSCEPLLEAVNLDPPRCQYCRDGGEVVEGDPPWCVRCDSEAVFGHWLDACASPEQPGINWLIAGGESGPGARPFDLAWARSLRDQCASAGVAYFCKQLGSNAIDSNGFDVMNDRGGVAYSRGNDVPGVEAMRLEALHKGRILRPHNYSRFLRDRAGADPMEFPEDLRIQQFPEVPRG